MNTFNDIATETPLEAYLRLRGDGGSFLLESVEHGRLGRHSFVGRGSRIVTFEEAESCGEAVVGYIAYDHVAKLEPTVPLPADGPALPESRFIVADELIRFDHGEDTPPLPFATRRPSTRRSRRRPSSSSSSGARRSTSSPETSSRSCCRSGSSARRARRPSSSIARFGMSTPRRTSSSSSWTALALIGSSPETLVKHEEGRASVNPIAGTAAPGQEEQLLRSEKDRAEHVMLVDLGRNDLSRVCEPGTCPRQAVYDRRALLAREPPRLRGDRGAEPGCRLLRPPAGLLPGRARSPARPKVRAMQLISELEGYRRGPYAGAVGYALPDGTLDTCIAIRTIVLADGVAHLQAGAGIVADSDPAAEHAECRAKLAALEQAIDLAEEEAA